MKLNFDQLNKVFDSRIRVTIMSVLMINAKLNFNDLKEYTEATDGNLATHLRTLEDAKYIKVEKGFIGRKTNTNYLITTLGKKAFMDHLTAIEKIIKSIK